MLLSCIPGQKLQFKGIPLLALCAHTLSGCPSCTRAYCAHGWSVGPQGTNPHLCHQGLLPRPRPASHPHAPSLCFGCSAQQRNTQLNKKRAIPNQVAPTTASRGGRAQQGDLKGLSAEEALVGPGGKCHTPESPVNIKAQGRVWALEAGAT